MRVRRAPVLVALLVVVTTAGATGTKVWEFSKASPLPPSSLPVRVHQLTLGQIRVFEKSGQASEVLSVRSRSTGMATVEVSSMAKAGPQTANDLCHFTEEGSIAWFEAIEEGRPLYARPFDVDRRAFAGVPLFVEHVLRFEVGPRVVAVFTERGPHKGDRLTPPDELSIGVVTRDGNACKLETRWQNRSYTHGIALDSNGAGDVVALVGKCEGGMIRFDCSSYHLVILKGSGGVLEREIPAATRASTVAISRSGESIAVALGDRVATYRLSNAEIEDGPSIRLGDCAPAGMWRVSIDDASAIVGVAISKVRVDVVCGRPGGICEVVATQPSSDVLRTDARFLQEGLFYVATTASDVTKSRLAIFRY